MNPLVSIIIPLFNREHLIIETLKSVQAQTYTNWECIVVDDGSTDDSFEVVSAFAKADQRIKILKSPADLSKGANACRNYGFENSTGNFIIFFDSDDIFDKNALESRVNSLVENVNVDMAIFKMGHLVNGVTVNDSTSISVSGSWEDALEVFLKLKKLPWNICRPIYRREILSKVSFNEYLKRFQDIDFNIRLLVKEKPAFISFDAEDCYYRAAATDNPRTTNFYKNVVYSIDVFIDSITEDFNIIMDSTHRKSLKDWVFRILRDYVMQDVSLKKCFRIIRSISPTLMLSFKERLILYALCIINKHYRGKKGHFFIYFRLKRWYY